jgi:tetratricopeptide (TPR) repeat protein
VTLADQPADGDPVFTRDVAPIIYRQCTGCHRPQGAGPFDLLTYEDARKRARQLVEVTRSGFMPPWQPEAGYGEFVGERRLSDDEMATIRRWVAVGAPEGPADELPAPPRFPDGWQLGKPDLVLNLPEPYVLPAEGSDVIRNFVLSIPVSEPRWVGAVELRPGNKKIVHHAILNIDHTRVSRQLDQQDPEPGFGGMDMGFSESPGGHTVIWAPGSVPFEGRGEMAWRLEPGTDLVLQLHMLPTGKPESLALAIGLHFTEQPPTIRPMELMLRNDAIDIPPGMDDYVLQDSLILPAPVDLLAICPHAHYLGRQLQAYAILPDLTRRWLIRIDDWDFNWQDLYYYREPIELPAGTTLVMRYTYDNSADNPSNPHHPPRRVVGGNDSSNEMANLLLQVRPRDRAGAFALRAAQFLKTLQRDPNNAVAHYNLGIVFAGAGDLGRAATHLEAAVGLQPSDRDAQFTLGSIYARQGKLSQAERQYRRTVEIAPSFPEAHYMLGLVLSDMARADEAAIEFDRVLQLDPDHARAHYRLGSILADRGDPEQAESHLRRALALEPELEDARTRLERMTGQR